MESVPSEAEWSVGTSGEEYNPYFLVHVLLGFRGLILKHIVLKCCQIEEQMLEEHVNIECGNIYKILKLLIPQPQ